MTAILALDTATSGCSAALWRDGSVPAHRSEIMPRGQSEALLPMVLAVLDEAGCAFPDLDLVAVTVGPGAFTGLRIGLSAARGMALAAKVPCLGLTTFDVLARAARAAGETGPLAVVLDTKRADLYVQAFGADDAPLTEPAAVMPDALPDALESCGDALTLVGDAPDIAAPVLMAAGVTVRRSGVPGIPDAGTLARLAAERWREGGAFPEPEPLYLRPPDAVKPKNGGRLR